MGKYCIILTSGGIAMIVSGVIAGITLYGVGAVDDSIGLVILTLIVAGIVLSAIGFYMLDWRKIFEGNTKKQE
jgi:hypothetical protein